MNSRILGKSKAIDPNFYLGLAFSLIFVVVFFTSDFGLSIFLTFSAICFLWHIFGKMDCSIPLSLLEIGIAVGAVLIFIGAVIRAIWHLVGQMPIVS